MRRRIGAALIATAVVTLTACGGGGGTSGDPDGGEKSQAPDGTGKTLTVWVDETRMAPTKAAADAFEKDTGAKVELVQKNFEDIRADFLAQVPTGEGPDITVGAHDWLGELTQNGVVSPVEFGDRSDEFTDVALEAFTFDGQVYGVPYAVENLGLIRNTKLAKDPAPDKFDDMIAKGKEAGTKYPFLIQVSDKGDPYTMAPFQHSFGAPVFEQNDDGSYSNKLALGGEKGEAFAKWLAQHGKKGDGVLNTSITYDIARDAFKKGEAPYMVGGPWLIDEFKDMELAVDPIPSAGGEPSAPFIGVQGFYVSSKTENAILATEFLVNYIGTKDVQVKMFEAGNRTPAMKEAAEEISSDPLAKGFADIAEDAKPMPSIPEMSAVWNFWGVTEAQIINGDAEPSQAWQKMVSDIEGAIG
ncbi:sugar ABC transporter substrate-binding protein [Enemella sp. A6]|uniref:sugar ABC transporter substrate-binding protein n=1 Tax=Enemella sp. A6 TaxID=3440152 RepID=UPI003EC00A21